MQYFSTLVSLVFTAQSAPIAEKDFVSWAAVGDWGGTPVPGLHQIPWGRSVASSMNRMAPIKSTDFIMLVGDNFYWDGVINLEDPRFEQTFEGTFRDQLTNLKDTPFYIQSGNHDYRGNVTAQILYSGLSNRWKFPSLWYTIERQVADFKVEIVYLDTNCLHDDTSTDEKPEENRHQEQMKWFEETMAKSTADYLIVSGHHPIFSAAEHGSQQFMVDQILPVMEKYGAQLYINGHDHQLQYITKPNGIGFITTGGATLPNPSRAGLLGLRQYGAESQFYWAKPFEINGGGYTQYVARSTGLEISFIDAHDDNELYQVVIPRRLI